MWRRLFLPLLLGLMGAAQAQTPVQTQARLPVVASFSVLGDLVQRVGGEDIALQLLVGPDSDAHAVQPSPAMARTVAGARLVFSIGLGFEGWMERLLRSAAFAGRHVVVSAGLKPREAADSHGHGHGPDPHVWQDVRQARHLVARIAEGFCAADAGRCDAYRGRAETLDAELRALDDEIRAAWSAVPAARRVVVTTHEAFGYYGAAYGVRFLAAQGLSSASEPTPRAVAALVRQIRASGSSALFLERAGDPRLIERIARETGVRPGGTLYADALSGAGGPAPGYAALMRHNTRTLLQALQP